jgi:hypothetical protein
MLEMVMADLAKCTMGVESPSSTISIFATAFLFLNLAVLTGVRISFLPCEKLKTNESTGQDTFRTVPDALC